MTQIWTKPWDLKIDTKTFYVLAKISSIIQWTGCDSQVVGRGTIDPPGCLSSLLAEPQDFFCFLQDDLGRGTHLMLVTWYAHDCQGLVKLLPCNITSR